VLVDLSEDSCRVIDNSYFPSKQPSYWFSKGKLSSRQNANRRVGIFWRSESASTGIEIAGGEFIANLGRT
jgi:hypothetical protein